MVLPEQSTYVPHAPPQTRCASFQATGFPEIDFPTRDVTIAFVIPFLFFPFRFSASHGIHRTVENNSVQGMSLSWRPSPCTELSSAPSTYDASDALHEHHRTTRLIISWRASHVHEDELKRDRLGGGYQSNQSRSLRYPGWKLGRSGGQLLPLDWYTTLTSLGHLQRVQFRPDVPSCGITHNFAPEAVPLI